MKYRNYLALGLCCAALMAGAQSKINNRGNILLNQLKEAKTAMSNAGAQPTEVSAIVRLAAPATVQLLEEQGYTVAVDLGDMAVVNLPYDQVDILASLPEVKSISLGGKKRPLLKAARAASGVDEAHAGIDLGQSGTRSFKGSGVIAGVFDSGLQPGHQAFSGRVERVWNYTGSNGQYTEYSASQLGSFTTDDRQETHGTHVLGIMAGGFDGTINYLNGSTKTTGANCYYGVAPEASIAIGCGQLYDPNIISGVEQIINYAESEGRPAVVNLSLGMNTGPHDGTDDFTQSLERLGRRGIICVAAGNEGADLMSIEKTFSSSDSEVKTMMFYNSAYTSNDCYVDIWASDDNPVTVSIFNVSSGGTKSNEKTFSSATYYSTYTTGVKSGSVAVSSGVDENNGRYNLLIEFSSALPKTGRFGISVKGANGQTVYLYTEGSSYFTNRYTTTVSPLSGYTAGSGDNSINTIACTESLISVGSYNTTNSWYALDGLRYGTGETRGAISSFSSYGRDFAGNQLPTVAAPGSTIMSTFNRYYISGGYGAGYGETASSMVGSTTGSTTDYWGPMDGTSMASPFAAGVCVLWLEADPTMDVADIKRVMANSSQSDTNTETYPDRFGYGKINAAEGLRYILNSAAVGSVAADADRCVDIAEASDGSYRITVAGAAAITASLVDLQGRRVASASASGSELTLDASSASAGIYLLSVESDNTAYSTKIVKH